MKEVVAAFNQEKALVGAFSVIVQPVVEPMDRFTALQGPSQLAVVTVRAITDCSVTGFSVDTTFITNISTWLFVNLELEV